MNGPEQGAPLSFAQQSLWFLHELYPADSSSNEQFCLSLDGPLDTARLAAAWRQLLLRHEVLRARFAEVNGQLCQCTDPPPAEALPLRDLAGLTAEELPGALRSCAEAALQTVLDPAAGELCRALLVRCTPDRHLLLVTAQHMVADGLSVPIIRDELARLYAAAGSTGADTLPGPAQYAAFSRQQLASMDPAAAARMAGWWQAQLADVPEAGLRAIQLPAADSERAVGLQTRLPIVIDTELADALRALARRSGCTLYMVLVAALRTVLYRYTGNQDLLIGTPMTWRDTAQLRTLVGCFVNPVALRTRLDPQQSFVALLKAERATVLGAIQHRGLPFSRVVASLGPARRYGQHPLFQVLFNYELAPVPQLIAAKVAFGITSIPARRRSAWELEIGITDHGAGKGLTGFVGYAEALFEDWLVSALPAQLAVLLSGVVRDPEQELARLPLLDKASLRRLEHFNASSAPIPAGTLHERFLARAADKPEAPALVDRGRQYSYRDLEQLTAVQTAALLALDVKVGDRIGVALPRSAELVCAMLAVLRAGAVIVPLDPGYPASRLKFMAEDAELAAVMTSSAVAGQLPLDGLPQLCVDQLMTTTGAPVPLPAVSATDPAWMLYTSGSTGQPKAAQGSHQAAVNRCHWMWQHCGLGPDEVFSLRTSPNFIDVLWEIFGALLHGAPLVIIPDEVATDPQPLAALLADHGVTQLVLVPSLLRLLLDEVPDAATRLSSLRGCICSGEPLEPALARRFMQTLPGVELLNTYGTSEIWDLSCYRVRDLPADASRVPIGAPIANMQAQVLDDYGQPVPIGITGELVAAGVGVSSGYWQRPALSAERYVAAPGQAGSYRYRTGDLARWRADGQLECLGRLDHQIKLRGVRMELAEIEQVLAAHPAIARAAVGLHSGADGEQQLLAWLLFVPGSQVDAGMLREHAQSRLPQAMVPQRWVVLDELPLTPSGKLDRARLPQPAASAATGGEPPRPGMESRLARLWSELLDCPVSSREQNFFELGGHSLLAIRLLSRIRSQLGAEPGLRKLFEAPLLWQQAACLEAGATDLQRPPLQALQHDGDALPLSFGQRRLWFLDQLDPGSAAWNIAFTLALDGPLDMAALHGALAGLEQRHELLRSCFPAAGGQPALRLRPATGMPPEVLLLPADEAARRQLLAELAGRPLELATGPLLRLYLLRAAEHQHTLLFVIHHIISDATSNHLLFAEFTRLYRAGVERRDAGLAPLPVRYVDYAAWQQRWLNSAALAPALAWWQARLAGAPARLELPVDGQRPAEQDFAGAWHIFRLPAALHLRVQEFARAQGTTSFVVLLAAFKVLLARLSGQSDVLVGTPVEGRLDQASEGLLGLFINTLVLRTDLSADPGFAELVTELAGDLLAAQEHQELPFEQLVEQLAPVRSLSHSPVFQVMFNLVRMPRREVHAAGLRIRLDRLIDQKISAFDLTLTAAEDDRGTELIFEYATSLFRPQTISRWAAHFLSLLESALEAPATTVQALPLLRPEERQALLATQAASRVDTAALWPVHELVRQQVRLRPDATALVDGERCLSYATLGQAVDRLAAMLAAAGAAPATRIAICLPRSADAVVALLATLETGAAYVLLDPLLPRARLELMLAAVGPQLLIAPDSLPLSVDCERLEPARQGAHDNVAARWSRPHIPLQSTACLQFTSGTSGEPRAVTVTHLNLASMQAAWQQVYAPAAGESHLQMAGIAFDVFSGDWVRALCSGGRLVFCPHEVLLDPPALHTLLHAQRIRIAEFVPAVVRHLLGWMEQHDARLDSLRLLIVGSDLWHGSEYLALRTRCAAGTRVINSYGLAECCIDSSWYEGEADPERPLPIGRAFPGTSLHVLDTSLSPVPPGVVGELYIGGTGVALGYHGLAELTAERFVLDPFSAEPGARLYRSGDRARLRADGELELLGRVDEQIKLRGFRIEPGEIEQQLLKHPGVREAVVVLREDRSGDGRLVAYLVGEAVPERSVLSAWLGERLPEYMVPALYVELERLPLTANGKVARRELPVPVWESVDSGSVGPRTGVEEALCGLFAEVLGVVRVGIHDDFFALGGHSLLATQLVSRIRDALSVELPLRALFSTPTVAGLTRAVAGAAADDGPVLEAGKRPEAPVPASLSQQRLWFLHRLRPASTAYHLHVLLHLDGPLDVPALEWSLQQMALRHEVLRTRIIERDGEPWQVIDAVLPSLLVEAEVAGSTLQARLADLVAQPFDLAAGPLFRLHLLPVRARADAHVLLLVMHHIISDGWSLAVFFRELAAAYAARIAGDACTLPPLAVQYADFARWQRDCLQGERLAHQLSWWRKQLAGAPASSLPPVQIQSVCPESAGTSNWYTQELPAGLLSSLRALARAQRCTLFMVLFAGFALLLSRLAGQADLLIGTPVAGRQRTALEGLIGFFVNTLVLRADLSGNPRVHELLARIRQMTLDAYAHQELPFEKLVELLRPPRDTSRNPLIQVLFNLHNEPAVPLQLTGLEVTPCGVSRTTSKFDLSVSLAETGSGLGMTVEYSTALFSASTIERWCIEYEDVLRGFCAQPEARLADFCWAEPPSRRACVPVHTGDDLLGVLAEVSVLNAQSAAVVTAAGTSSYAELERLSNRMAHTLLSARGAGSERVGLWFAPGVEMVAALLAVLKAGKCFVPLDPALPAGRLAWQVADAGIGVLLAGERAPFAELSQLLPDDWSAGPETAPVQAVAPESLAYLLYTSGTTGKPKAVMQTQAGLLAQVAAWSANLGLGATDRLSLLSGYGYDAAIQDVFGALLSGAAICPLDVRGQSRGELLSALGERAVTVLHATPTVFRYLLSGHRGELALGSVRLVVLGGEEARRGDLSLFRSHCRRGAQFVNGYGLTECTVALQYFADHDTVLSGESLPVGLPVGELSVSLRDEQGAEAGLCGEIVLRSRRLSPGYWPGEVPPAAERVLATGDLARRLGDGQLVWMGRRDAQLKLGGQRIEPAEVEAVLGRHPAVGECAVGVRGQGAEARLVAWYVPLFPVAVEDLRAHLSAWLPAAWVPASWVALSALPRRSNGKLERERLELVLATAPVAEEDAPETELEATLLGLWQLVLDRPVASVRADFFALGGHSLLATRLIARIRDRLGVELPLIAFFEQPTIRGLAKVISEQSGQDASPATRSGIPAVPLRAASGRESG